LSNHCVTGSEILRRFFRVWLLRAWVAVICVGGAGCSKLGIYVDEDVEKPPPPPVVLDKFVWHRYDSGRETQRIAGEVAYYYEKDGHIDVDNITAYFYDEKDPFGKMSVLNAKKAVLHMADSPTTPAAFLSGDVEFQGDVSFVNRSGYWVQSNNMRFHKKEQLLKSDGATTQVVTAGDTVLVNSGNDAFSFDLRNHLLNTNDPHTEFLGGESGRPLRELVKKKIDAIVWVTPTDDKSIAIRDAEKKP
jgi:hypothetical protein